MNLDESINLAQIGFHEGVLYEVIATTVFPGTNIANAAPMGLRLVENNLLEVKPFQTTDTFTNLKTAGKIALNITGDPLLFTQTALKGWCGGQSFPELAPEKFAWDSESGLPYLQGVDLVLFCDLEELIETTPRSEALLQCSKIFKTEKVPVMTCRANHLVLEGLIHATRVNVYLDQHNPTEARKYFDLASFYCEEALKFQPDQHATRAINLIREFITGLLPPE